MKSIYLFVLNLFIFVHINSQAPLLVPKINGSNHIERNEERTVKRVLHIKSTTRSTASSEWINAIGYVSNFLGPPPYIGFTNPIFPDSNVIVFDTSANSTPWLHGICQTFDLGGGYLNTTGGIYDPMVQIFCEDELFTIDTIWINGYYQRTNNSVVDTAIVSIVSKNHGNYTRAFNVGRIDSLIYIIDDKNRDNSPDSTIWTGKIILDSTFYKDTVAGGGHIFKLTPAKGVVNSNGIIGVSLEFKPGNNYSQATDTIFKNQNYISVVYATPFGQNTSFPLGQTGNRETTIGSFSDNNTKYNSTVFDYYLPPIAFTTHHPYQLYDISVFISQSLSTPYPCYTGINELTNGAKLFQNFPNPINGNTSINYSLENNANVSFEMMDVTGKIVLSQNEGNKTSGMHTITVNTSELTAGIYFYSVVVNNQKLTKKMTITK